MVKETWELSLDVEHRALLAMARERVAGNYEQAALDNMTKAELVAFIVAEMRREMIRIPAGAEAVACRWCLAPVYWLPSRYGKDRKESVSIAGVGCRAATAEAAGEGIAHLADCPSSGFRPELFR
jgi:hypothetical protein